MTRRQPTEAQKQAAKERRAKIMAMAKRIAAMTPEQQAELTRQNIITIEGHALSHKNQMMVAFQGCKSTVVGGFQQWKKAGRQVRKGEHGFGIWFPIGAPKLDDPNGESSDIHFAVSTVFGIDQTDPIGEAA